MGPLLKGFSVFSFEAKICLLGSLLLNLLPGNLRPVEHCCCRGSTHSRPFRSQTCVTPLIWLFVFTNQSVIPEMSKSSVFGGFFFPLMEQQQPAWLDEVTESRREQARSHLKKQKQNKKPTSSSSVFKD